METTLFCKSCHPCANRHFLSIISIRKGKRIKTRSRLTTVKWSTISYPDLLLTKPKPIHIYGTVIMCNSCLDGKNLSRTHNIIICQLIMYYSLTESEVITRKSQTETLIQFKALSTSKKLKNRQRKVKHCLAMALTVTKSLKEFAEVFNLGWNVENCLFVSTWILVFGL